MIKQEFKLSSAAFEELRRSVNALKTAEQSLKGRLFQQREAYKNNMKNKNEEIERLRQIIAEASNNIAGCVSTIEEVLDQNGSSHDSN